MERLVNILPKLRNQFGLIGLIVMVGAFVATRQIAPGSLNAQISAGGIGVTIVVFGQIFYFLKDIPARDRARLIMLMFLMFCAFIVALIASTAYFAAAAVTSISSVTLRADTNDGPGPNTLDELVLRWAHDGPDGDLDVAIARTESDANSGPYRVRAADHVLHLSARDLKQLWAHPELNTSYSVRVAFQGKDRVQRFGPYEVRVALRIMFFYEGGRLTVASLADERNLVAHDFTAKCLAWPERANAASGPQSVEIRAVGGKGVGLFAHGFVADPATIKCAYLGPYPADLVRYQNVHVG